MINHFLRYQKGLALEHLFPSNEKGLCSCGCKNKLTGNKRKWWSKDCQKKSLLTFYVIKGDQTIIRDLIFQRDFGFCRNCGVYDENWNADHILPVFKGGGGRGLDNYQTLCPYCHLRKTKLDRIPNCLDVFTSSFNIFHSPLECFRTFHKTVAKDII